MDGGSKMTPSLSVCTNCGAPTVIERGEYRFTECGLSNVVLHGIDPV